MQTRSPFDGLRPRNVVCTLCGYHISGAKITGGFVICPECGHRVEFALKAPRPARRRSTMILWWIFLVSAFVGTLFAAEIPLRMVLVATGFVLLFLLLLRGARSFVNR